MFNHMSPPGDWCRFSNFYVSVRGVLKDIHQSLALVDLTKVLLDLLDENGCLAAARS
jgi:hypothetical protein